MSSSSRRLALVPSLLLVVGLTAGCTGGEPAASPSPTASSTASASPSATPAPSPTPTTVTSPLRGTQVEPDEVTGPALSAKIDNLSSARPQWGLEHTDLVFEELVEGGLTRYVATWFSDVPKEVGPVRSVRPMDPDIVAPMGGILAFSGGKQQFIQMVWDTDLHAAIHGGKDTVYMYRSTEKAAPHNVVLMAQDIRAAYADMDAPPQQFTYADKGTAAMFGTAADGIDAVFSELSTRSWRWSGKSNAYLRSQDGVKDLDSNGDRLKATNVVAIEVDIDWSYGAVPRTVMIDSGKAWVSTGGKTIAAKWSKKDQTSPIVLTTTSGTPLNLAPGNSWIELVPEAGSVTVVR